MYFKVNVIRFTGIDRCVAATIGNGPWDIQAVPMESRQFWEFIFQVNMGLLTITKDDSLA